MNLIGKLRREKEFRQQCCRNSTKNEEREKEKGGERKQRNFGNRERKQRNFDNTVTEIPLPKMLPVQLKKKAIAATPLPKKEKKNLFWQLWRLPKMEKQNYEICE